MHGCSRTWFTVVASLVAACSVDLKVGPPTGDDEGGKADGASSGKVELKVTIATNTVGQSRADLGLSSAASQTRRIWFYDTPTLELYATGVILRSREIDGDADDSTVKLRPFTLDQLDSEFQANDDMKCELDRDPDSATPSCSLKAKVTARC